MTKKIAILFAASIYNQKGLFNAAHNRILHLSKQTDLEIDAYILSSYLPLWILKLTGKKKEDRPDTFMLDGIRYHIFWYQNSIIDYVCNRYFHVQPFFKKRIFRGIAKRFSNYDLIESHSGTNEIAEYVHRIYGTPYCITWHGSDIHTEPFRNKSIKKNVIRQMESANCNFFVSNSLLLKSNELSPKGKKCVLYNGVDLSFKKYSHEKRTGLRQEFKLQGKKVVAFAGNIIPIKNVLSIPSIFRHVFNQNKNIEFWILGEGPLKKKLYSSTLDLPIKFLGNVAKCQMPDYLNSIDVLILPSLNEGLPLITIEALSCGCKVVGSDVGGIHEVIGGENCIPLSELDFEKKFADRIVYFLSHNVQQKLDPKFDWRITAMQESDILHAILNNHI